jgi:hypothetical protein
MPTMNIRGLFFRSARRTESRRVTPPLSLIDNQAKGVPFMR